MFCEECGNEIPDDASFCKHCGKKIVNNNIAPTVGKEKNMIVALIISFLLTGLGIVYAGNTKKGILLFVASLIFAILGMGIPFFSVIGILIWVYGLYATYNEVKIANGVSNPNMIEDFKTFSTPKKIGFAVVVLFILLVMVGGIMGALAPHDNNTIVENDDSMNLSDDSIDSSADSSNAVYSSSNSGSGDSYSSSSNGRDVSSHYEGEYGSADTEGRINDDGSVDAHQTGHTDYGDYEINSHMDSDGNIHGTVDVGGKTYYVDS